MNENENIFDYTSRKMSEILKQSQEDHMEFIMSEIHECDETKDNGIIFYTTTDKKLRYCNNSQSIFGFKAGSEVKCCMWCGFKP